MQKWHWDILRNSKAVGYAVEVTIAQSNIFPVNSKCEAVNNDEEVLKKYQLMFEQDIEFYG